MMIIVLNFSYSSILSAVFTEPVSRWRHIKPSTWEVKPPVTLVTAHHLFLSISQLTGITTWDKQTRFTDSSPAPVNFGKGNSFPFSKHEITSCFNKNWWTQHLHHLQHELLQQCWTTHNHWFRAVVEMEWLSPPALCPSRLVGTEAQSVAPRLAKAIYCSSYRRA